MVCCKSSRNGTLVQKVVQGGMFDVHLSFEMGSWMHTLLRDQDRLSCFSSLFSCFYHLLLGAKEAFCTNASWSAIWLSAFASCMARNMCLWRSVSFRLTWLWEYLVSVEKAAINDRPWSSGMLVSRPDNWDACVRSDWMGLLNDIENFRRTGPVRCQSASSKAIVLPFCYPLTIWQETVF